MASSGTIEVEFASGARMRIAGAVDAAVDTATVTTAIAALVGGQQR